MGGLSRGEVYQGVNKYIIDEGSISLFEGRGGTFEKKRVIWEQFIIERSVG